MPRPKLPERKIPVHALLDPDLLAHIDRLVAEGRYDTRSSAIRCLLRSVLALCGQETGAGRECGLL